jgi:hypothetical protein
MAAISVVVYRDSSSGHDVVLSGTDDGTNFSLSKLVLPGAIACDLQTFLAGPSACLVALTGGTGEFRFKTPAEISATVPVPAAVTLSSDVTITGTTKIFGRTFKMDGDLKATLTIAIRGASDASGAPAVSIQFCGRVDVSGAGAFAPAPFCYIFRMDDFPAAFPASLPSLDIAPPDLGFRLPKVSLPFDLSALPLTFRLPAFSAALDPLPIRVSYKAVDMELAVGPPVSMTLTITGLRFQAELKAIEGDAKIVVKSDGTIDTANSSYQVTSVSPSVTLSFAKFLFDAKGIIFSGSGDELDDLIDWIMPELNELHLRAKADWAVRLLRSGTTLTEARLDIKPDKTQTLALLGFALDVAAGTTYHMIADRDAGAARFRFAVSVPSAGDLGASFKNNPLAAEVSWTWPGQSGDGDRELIKDDQHPDPIFAILAKPDHDRTVSVARFKLSDRSIAFFDQQCDPALGMLEPSAANPYDPTPGFTPGLGNWTLDFLSKLPTPPGSFNLPFLRNGAEGDPLQQFLSLTELKPTKVASDAIDIQIGLRMNVGPLELNGQFTLTFEIPKFALKVDADLGIAFSVQNMDPKPLFGFQWAFESAGPLDLAKGVYDFTLLTKNGNYQIKQGPLSKFTLSFDRATTGGTTIDFHVSNFTLSPKGISLDATVENNPAKLNGLNTEFRFTFGSLRIQENRIADFVIAGSGALPPDLVGTATADARLHFAQNADTTIALKSAEAKLQGSNLLKCNATRFQFNISQIGLKYVDDGRYHLYFTLWGTARFVLASGDPADGALSFLPTIELELVECPLTGDASVIAKHVQFHIALPTKKTFPVLGCFQMELRGISFVPQSTVFATPTAAMRVSGQVKFAESGDAVDARIDFHDLFIGLPRPGEFFPQIHMKGLAIKLSVGGAFDLAGSVDFVDEGTNLGGGITGEGFTGSGEVQIQGLPKLTAAFAFMRVKRPADTQSLKAWFLYLEASQFSLQIPVIEIFIREIGLGFGYRYTLTMIKTSDNVDDPKQLIKTLKTQARSQGELSKIDQWAIDIEDRDHDPRWTIAFRGMISQTSASAGITDWNPQAEEVLPCLFLVDVVAALRSDLTFLMVARGWLFTNYADFVEDYHGVRTAPLFAGFILLAPRKKRFLANLSSNPNAAFGRQMDNMFQLIKDAIKSSNFTATLLVEPGLIHAELGWPNQLRLHGDLGPLQVEIEAGMIYRLSSTEFVIGNSFLAKGSLAFSAGIDLGFIGARISATASVAYGARYIGVIAFDDFFHKSAFYGAVGIEIHVAVALEFWIEIDLLFGSIKMDFSFSFAVTFTASLEVGILVTPFPPAGLRGTATVAISVMGHDLQFGVKIGILEDRVDTARNLTNKFLQMGLEASEVEPIPGTTSASAPLAAPLAPPALAVPSPTAGAPTAAVAATPATAGAPGAAPAPADAPKAPVPVSGTFYTPSYTIYSIPSSTKANETYLLLMPAGETPPGVTPHTRETGFLPTPPSNAAATTADFAWTFALPATGTLTLQQLIFDDTVAAQTASWVGIGSGTRSWKANWGHKFTTTVDKRARFDPNHAPSGTDAMTLRDMLITSFIPKPPSMPGQIKSLADFEPESDPFPLPEFANEGKVEDARVRNPSQDCFEAAVRGAADQFESAPFFKSSDNVFDQTLLAAFDPKTTLYSPDGTLPDQPTGPATAGTRDKVNAQAHVSQMRGVVIKGMINDLQALATGGEGNLSGFANKSVAAQMGLIFKFTGDDSALLAFLALPSGSPPSSPLGTIQQRTSPSATSPVAVTPAPIVWAFNSPDTRFDIKPPRLRNVIQYAHANMVAMDWELAWDDGDPAAGRRSDDPEHHLAHYQVRRVSLDGNEPDQLFQVKVPDVLHLEVDSSDPTNRDKHQLKRCYSRFQFVDHFDGEAAADAAALPEQGKRYVYTITPYDITLRPSTRPISVIVRRMPAVAPPVPTDAELWIDYLIPLGTSLPRVDNVPTVRPPDGLTLVWTHPPDPAIGPVVRIASYRLVFRREPILPVGFYGLSAEDAAPPSRGLPSSNARLQRTDLIGPDLLASNTSIRDFVDPDSGRRRLYYHLAADDLTALQVPKSGSTNGQWEQSSWRVFIQTKSVNGVYSALAPVATRLRFCPQGSAPPLPGDLARRVEERQVAAIEWFAFPFRLNLLPPRDCTGSTGFAMVPMPQLGKTLQSDLTQSLEFVRHPQGRRCLHFHWNRGPTDHTPGAPQAAAVPPDLVAAYELYEFDADAHIPATLNEPGGQTEVFPTWADDARLRKAQEIDLLSPEDVLMTPADTADFLRWEAWYPSDRRLQQIASNLPKSAAKSQAVSPPWYSWAESLLEWPPVVWDPGGGQAKVSFVEQKLAPDGKTQVWVRSLDKNGRPRAIHPALAAIMDQVAQSMTTDATRPYRAVRGPLPARMPANLTGLMSDTGAKVDPYGWCLLQLLGLSASFCVRHSSLGDTGEPDSPADLVSKVFSAIQALGLADLRKFLHVEYLYQPAKSTRASSDEPFGPSDDTTVAADDLLAIIQISLRPALRPWAGYLQAEVDLDSTKISKATGLAFASGDLLITVTSPVADPKVILVIQADTDLTRIPLVSDPGGKQTKLPFALPATGVLKLFFRVPSTSPATTVDLKLDWKPTGGEPTPTTTPPLNPTDATTIASTYFLADIDSVEAATQMRDAADQSTWVRLAAYVGGLNGAIPSTPQAIALPATPSDSNGKGAELLGWLDRFFLRGGDAVNGSTGGGPWPATAYLRAVSPIAVTPDEKTGVLDYYHPIEDPYAHAYRYYFRPIGRYDRLWESVAQAPSLVGFAQALQVVTWGDGSAVPTTGRDLVIIGIDNPGLLHIRVFDGAGVEVIDTDENGLKGAEPFAINTLKLQIPSLLPPNPVTDGARTQVLAEVTALVGPPPDASGRASASITSRLNELRRFATPEPGGLDLVLYRTRPIAEPTVLHTGRLDAIATASGDGTPKVQPAPPGRYWQVIVAKHPEQTLSEHNQTLALRLGYRQVAWSLVRTFNPDDVSSQTTILGLFRARVSKPYATPDNTPVAITPHKMFLLLEGPTPVNTAIDLGDAAHDNLNGLAAALLALGLDGVSATVVTPVPGRSFLRVWSPPGTTLHLGTDTAPQTSDILSDANSIRPAKSVRSPALPGPPPVPVPFDYGVTASDANEAIEVDLAARLGRFGEGAIALSWQTLPYYYEHKLLLIALSTNTVSDVVSITQRAFEYVSPEPRAIVDGVVSRLTSDASLDITRVRRVRFRLADYWSCLPSKANGETPGQDSWPIEDPDRVVLTFSGAHPPTPASSDPLAKRVEIDDSDVPATLTWLLGYQLSSNEAASLEAWRANTAFSAEFRTRVGELLEQLQLRQWRMLSSLPDPAVVYQFVLSKPGAVVQVLSEFYFGPDPNTKKPGYQPRNFNPTVGGVQWHSSPPVPLPEDTDPARPRDAYLQTQLGPKGVVSDNWISARAITSSSAIKLPKSVPPELMARLAFDPPDVLTLAAYSDTAFTAAEASAIRNALLSTPSKPGDAAFRAAVGRFCDRLKNGEKTIVEPVAIGLEALAELSPNVTLPAANPGKLTWLGPISADQAKVIQRWIEHLSPFVKTLQALLAADAAFSISVSYTAAGKHPKPSDVPAALAPNLMITLPAAAGGPETLVWKGRVASAAQDAALAVWENDSTLDQNFRDAVKALRNALAHPETQSITIDVNEPGWQPRPSPIDLATALGTLADRVQIGVGQILFKGLMLRTEAEMLLAAATAKVDQAAIAALYLDAVNGGFAGATLQIRAYRGSAQQESRAMEVTLVS